MTAAPPLTPAQPPPGLLAVLRALDQHCAASAAMLAPMHALVLAMFLRLLGLAAHHQAPCPPFPDRRPSAVAQRAGFIVMCSTPIRHATRAPAARAIARLLYVIGPRPRTGMRALPNAAPVPRQHPPIRPPPRPCPCAAGPSDIAQPRPKCYDMGIKIPTAPASAAAAISAPAAPAAARSPPATAPSAPRQTPPPGRTGCLPPGSPPQSPPPASGR